MSVRKPKLIVFDLDYTLWPFWVDTHVEPPFRKGYENFILGSNGKVVDSRGREIKYYPEVPEVLKKLHEDGYVLAVASRTSEIPGANQLLQLWEWDKYFSFKEIYPSSKVNHFTKFKNKSGLDYKDMLFFDDEDRNIKDLNQLGVTSILVRCGVNAKIVEDGLKIYSEEHSSD